MWFCLVRGTAVTLAWSASRSAFTNLTRSLLLQVVNFWAGYQRRVETDPVPTKALTSFLGFVIGDFFAQKIEGGPYNILRYFGALP